MSTRELQEDAHTPSHGGWRIQNKHKGTIVRNVLLQKNNNILVNDKPEMQLCDFGMFYAVCQYLEHFY